jgi:hypothetical protein
VRLLFALPVAVLVIWGMASNSSGQMPSGTAAGWVVGTQESLGALALVGLGAATVAPRRVALVLLVVDIVLVVAWLFAAAVQGSS